MSRQILIGLVAEGPTDKRFLVPLITRVFEQLAHECEQATDILSVTAEDLERQDLPEYILAGARKFYEFYDLLCVHIDSDAASDDWIRRKKLTLGLHRLAEAEGNVIRFIVPIIPVRTIENWLLADRAAFRRSIRSPLTARELGIDRKAESYRHPKDAIKEALRREAARKSGRKQIMHPGQLYTELGQTASLEELLKLPSFQKFYAAARQSLIDLGLIVPE